MADEKRHEIIVPLLIWCARCGQNHANIVFKKLLRPCEHMTYWASCPQTGEPIMLKIEGETHG